MGTPQCNYHKKLDKWKLFEIDNKDWESDREKYKGISPRTDNYAFVYRWKGKQVKSCQRLADIYEFKLEWESNHAG